MRLSGITPRWLPWCSFFLILFISGALGNGLAQALNWRIQTVDGLDRVGWKSSLALDSTGRPHIVYYDAAHGHLKYARWMGNSWEFQAVDETADGQEPSLVPDALGTPHISYYDFSNRALKYAFNYGGPSNMWWIDLVDNQGVGWNSSLALDNQGEPHISYYDFTNSKLKYAFRSNGRWVIQILGKAGYGFEAGADTSLVLSDSGVPYISYYDKMTTGTGQLRMIFKTNDTWWPLVVDAAAGMDLGRGSSIALDTQGRPHISYIDATQGLLKYAYHNGTDWEIIGSVDNAGIAGTSLALDAGNGIHISYYDHLNGKLKYAFRSSVQAPWVIQTVDPSGNQIGEFSSLALDKNGKPRISYFDRTAEDLKLAVTLYQFYLPILLVDQTGP